MITSSSTEEFSFPIIMSNNPLASFVHTSSFLSSSHSLSSSSLWRINSSRVFHHHELEQPEEDDYDDDLLEVQSMCEGFAPIRRREFNRASFQGAEVEVEERMDYLWEDFNEEMEEDSVRRGNGVCILEGTKMGRRPTTSSGMLVMGKLLKGIFSFRRKPKITRSNW